MRNRRKAISAASFQSSVYIYIYSSACDLISVQFLFYSPDLVVAAIGGVSIFLLVVLCYFAFVLLALKKNSLHFYPTGFQ